jgi:hypothetical protein
VYDVQPGWRRFLRQLAVAAIGMVAMPRRYTFPSVPSSGWPFKAGPHTWIV